MLKINDDKNDEKKLKMILITRKKKNARDKRNKNEIKTYYLRYRREGRRSRE